MVYLGVIAFLRAPAYRTSKSFLEKRRINLSTFFLLTLKAVCLIGPTRLFGSERLGRVPEGFRWLEVCCLHLGIANIKQSSYCSLKTFESLDLE